MEEVSYQVMKIQSLMLKQLMRGLTDTEISTGQPKVLAYLHAFEGKCQKDIAEACLIEPGSLTILLNRMEMQNMIERRFQGSNRKTRYVYLTEYGKSLADRVIKRFYEVQEMTFRGFSEGEADSFQKMCARMLDNLTLE